MNGIIYLTINSVSRRSNDTCIVMRISSCETALMCKYNGLYAPHPVSSHTTPQQVKTAVKTTLIVRPLQSAEKFELIEEGCTLKSN